MSTREPRRARIDDGPEIARLQTECNPVPWSERLLMQTITGANAVTLVTDATAAGRLAAYLVAQRLPDEWHVLDVGVGLDVRRQGIGRSLMLAIIGHAAEHGGHGVLLEVRASNDAGISLYRGLGFADNGVRPKYYSNNGEDALVMYRVRDGLAW